MTEALNALALCWCACVGGMTGPWSEELFSPTIYGASIAFGVWMLL